MYRQSEKQCGIWMLNLRFVLILFVFIASGIEPLLERFDVLHPVYLWIFTFHMPLFAYVTGYFSRSNLFGREGLAALCTIAVQYVVFQSLYNGIDVLFFHASDVQHSFFSPYLMLWFLVAHFFWRLLLKAMLLLRIKHVIAVAIAIGIAAGYWGSDGSWLSLSRSFVFYPFFAAGYLIEPGRLMSFYRSKRRVWMASLPIVLFTVIMMFAWHESADWLYGKYTYAELDAVGFQAAVVRAAVYAVQIAAAAGIIALIPKRRTGWTDLGKRTLYVFLLHGLILRTFIRLDLYGSITHWIGVLALLAVIVAMTVILARPETKGLTEWFIEPKFPRIGLKRLFTFVSKS